MHVIVPIHVRLPADGTLARWFAVPDKCNCKDFILVDILGSNVASLPPPTLLPRSYIEMMCSTPRADNAEARAILAPDQAATRAEKHQVQIRAELSKKTEAIDMQKGASSLCINIIYIYIYIFLKTTLMGGAPSPPFPAITLLFELF